MKKVMKGWRGALGHGAGRYSVADEKRFERVLTRLVQLYGEGNERRAAKAMGIPADTLYRLRRRHIHMAAGHRLATLSHETAQRLESAARAKSDRLAGQVLSAILSPDGMRLRRAFHAWCLERRDRILYRRGRYQARRFSYLYLVESRVHKEFGPLLDSFSARMDRKLVPNVRQEVALRRVVEPLAESSESGFIERQWGELDKVEKRAFLEAGIRREEVLLKRTHDVVRARAVAEARPSWLTELARKTVSRRKSRALKKARHQ